MKERPVQDFLCSYFHDGDNWSLTLKAYDWDDAVARVAKLGNLRLDGEVVMTLPAGPGTGGAANVLCYIRNKFFKQS